MKNILITIWLSISILTYIQADDFEDFLAQLPNSSVEYNPKANPHKDLSIAMQKAEKSGKKILMMVGGNWCKWCGTLDNFLEDQEKISKDFYSSFEVVRVYYGAGMNEQAKTLLKQFPPIAGTPHFYILNHDAKLLKSISTSYLERGYGYNKTKIKKFIKENKTHNKPAQTPEISQQ
jgi:thioredoxin-related protein